MMASLRCLPCVLLLVVFAVGLSFAAVTEIRWCTISNPEEAKCNAMRTAFQSQSLDLPVVCVPGDSLVDCMAQIEGGRADLITLDGGDVYTAGKEYNLIPVLQEVYTKDTYHAIVVVRANDTELNINNLEGKKSCHTGVRRTAGWNVPVGFFLDRGIMQTTDCGDDINAVANFFNQSCAPGAFTPENNPYGSNPSNLCAICGSPDCPKTDIYASYSGAFRCLAEGRGDVAFIKPETIADNTDMRGTADWNRDLRSQDFELLCPDGTRAPVADAEICNLAKSPAHAVMTSGYKPRADITAFQEVLQQAVTLFGADDNTNGFLMFDSQGYGSEDATDLLFKDTTQSLKNLATGMTYRTYLGSYANTIDGLKKCPANTLRWCTISSEETRKCRDMKEAFKGAGITPILSCYEESNPSLCMDRLASGDADVLTVDGGDLYTGGRENKVVPIAGEDYDDQDTTGDASYWAVAVARAGTSYGIDDLEQQLSCHTGIGKTSGWNVPVGHLIKTGHIVVEDCNVPEAVGDFFSQSCAPGAKSPEYDPDDENPVGLCGLCAGEGTNHCVRNSAEPYYGYAGAFRCLAEMAGNVAFVKHTTVMENTDNAGTLEWNRNLDSSDYELLCPNNTRAPVNQWKTCNLAKVPSHTVVTAKTKTTAQRQEIWTLLDEGQARFGSDEGDNFKMFDSNYGASNLLFKDSTEQLVSVGDKDTFEKWLSEEYVSDLDALHCDGGSAAVQASVVATVLTLFAHLFWLKY